MLLLAEKCKQAASKAGSHLDPRLIPCSYKSVLQSEFKRQCRDLLISQQTRHSHSQEATFIVVNILMEMSCTDRI